MFLPHTASTVTRRKDGIGMIRRGSALLALVVATMITAIVSSATAGEVAEDPRARWDEWLRAGYERAPALVLGLAVMVAMLPLAFAGRLVRGAEPPPDPDPSEAAEPSRRPAEATQVMRGPARLREVQTVRDPTAARPVEAWLEVAGAEGRRWALGRGMVRIGREEDNDIRLPLATVHRYHAVLHRTSDAEYVITDLSSADGNGLIVNGRRLAEARLKDGDRVQLGAATLTFAARPA
jgi:hypothetical protein